MFEVKMCIGQKCKYGEGVQVQYPLCLLNKMRVKVD